MAKSQVVVNALNKDDSFLNFLEMNASALDPDLRPVPLSMRQDSTRTLRRSFPATSRRQLLCQRGSRSRSGAADAPVSRFPTATSFAFAKPIRR